MRKNQGVNTLSRERSRIMDHIRNQDPALAQRISALEAPKWYRLKNQAEESAELYIYDEIMPKWIADLFGSGVSAEGLIEELNDISANTINVRINSPGGAVFEAIAIYNALVAHSATINVYVDSIAASAASVIAMAGDNITMMVGSQLMIHDAMNVQAGNAADMREMADFLDRQSDNIASIYAEKAGGETKEFRDLMLAETWLYAEEAVELGLADEVYTRPKNAPGESEEAKPDEEESEPSPDEEEPESESEEDEDMPDEDEEMQNLMSRRHKLVARGYKYAGRRRAPDPLENEVDAILAALKG